MTAQKQFPQKIGIAYNLIFSDGMGQSEVNEEA